MIIGVDHVLIAVDVVERATEAYRRLGFQVLPGGEHPRMQTYNALAPLADGTYLELIGVKDKIVASRFPNTRLVVQALASDNRLATFALLSNGIADDIARLRGLGIVIGDPVEGERVRPDGQKVQWRSAHFNDPDLPFLIEDITPHELRVPVPTEGLGLTAFLAEVELQSSNVEDASRKWGKMLGSGPTKDDVFRLERCLVRITRAAATRTGLDEIALALPDFDKEVGEMAARGVKLNTQPDRAQIELAASLGAAIALVAAA